MSSKSTYYINSLPVEANKYDSKNNTPIKAIVVFSFDINELTEFDFISLMFPNHVDNQKEEVVIQYNEFKESLYRNNYDINNIFSNFVVKQMYISFKGQSLIKNLT